MVLPQWSQKMNINTKQWLPNVFNSNCSFMCVHAVVIVRSWKELCSYRRKIEHDRNINKLCFDWNHPYRSRWSNVSMLLYINTVHCMGQRQPANYSVFLASARVNQILISVKFSHDSITKCIELTNEIQLVLFRLWSKSWAKQNYSECQKGDCQKFQLSKMKFASAPLCFEEKWLMIEYIDRHKLYQWHRRTHAHAQITTSEQIHIVACGGHCETCKICEYMVEVADPNSRLVLILESLTDYNPVNICECVIVDSMCFQCV